MKRGIEAAFLAFREFEQLSSWLPLWYFWFVSLSQSKSKQDYLTVFSSVLQLPGLVCPLLTCNSFHYQPVTIYTVYFLCSLPDRYVAKHFMPFFPVSTCLICAFDILLVYQLWIPASSLPDLFACAGLLWFWPLPASFSHWSGHYDLKTYITVFLFDARWWYYIMVLHK